MLAGILHLSSQRGLYFAGFTLLPKLETAVIDSFAKQWYKLKIFFNCFFCTEGYQPHLVSNQWDLYLLISSEALRNIKPGTVERKNHAQLLLQNLVIGFKSRWVWDDASYLLSGRGRAGGYLPTLPSPSSGFDQKKTTLPFWQKKTTLPFWQLPPLCPKGL